MPKSDLRDKLVSYIADAAAMESNVETMLGRLIDTTENAEMKARLQRHLEETRQQQQRLQECLEAHGESSSGIKDMAAKAGAGMKGLMDMARGDKEGRNARDGYATEHMEIAAYQLLERVATKAGDHRAAEVARQNRAEEEDMASFIDARWDSVAMESLRQEGVLR